MGYMHNKNIMRQYSTSLGPYDRDTSSLWMRQNMCKHIIKSFFLLFNLCQWIQQFFCNHSHHTTYLHFAIYMVFWLWQNVHFFMELPQVHSIILRLWLWCNWLSRSLQSCTVSKQNLWLLKTNKQIYEARGKDFCEHKILMLRQSSR